MIRIHRTSLRFVIALSSLSAGTLAAQPDSLGVAAKCDRLPSGRPRLHACSLAVAANPADARLRATLATEYARAQQWELALRTFTAAASIDSAQSSVRRDTLLSWINQERYAEVADLLARDSVYGLGSDLEPRLRAFSLAQLGRNSEAIASYLTAIERQPLDGRLYVAIGDLYRRVEKPRESITAYRLVTSLPGVDSVFVATAWARLAATFAELGRPATALFFWDQALCRDATYFQREPEERELYSRSLRAAGFPADSTANRGQPQPVCTPSSTPPR